VALPQVYVMLATLSRLEITTDETNYYFVGDKPPESIRRFFVDDDPEKPLTAEFDPDWSLPAHAIIAVDVDPMSGHGHAPNVRILHIWRSLLATDAVQKHSRFVLLGDPGSGKSTFLRHRCSLCPSWIIPRPAYWLLDSPSHAPYPSW